LNEVTTDQDILTSSFTLTLFKWSLKVRIRGHRRKTSRFRL